MRPGASSPSLSPAKVCWPGSATMVVSTRACSSASALSLIIMQSGSDQNTIVFAKFWLIVQRACRRMLFQPTGLLGCTMSAPVRDASAYAASAPVKCPWQARNTRSGPMPSRNAFTQSSNGLGQDGSAKQARMSGRS